MDNALKTITEVNPGLILPPFVITSWTETRIEAHRDSNALSFEVTEEIRTSFDRLNGRMIQYSIYKHSKTGAQLTDSELEAFEKSQVAKLGRMGYLQRGVLVAECKRAQQSF